MEIRLNKLSKRFGTKWLFQDINYTFKQGNVYALTGRNGSGKSTLLKILAGYLKPSKGEINWVEGEVSLENEIIHKKISFTAPYVKLPEEMSLEEVVNFYINFKPFQNSMSIATFAERIQLMNEIYNPLHQFSMGMMQRVKLGLALFGGCPIILLDEPTSNLDLVGKRWFFDLLNTITTSSIVIMASNEAEEIKYANYQLAVDD